MRHMLCLVCYALYAMRHMLCLVCYALYAMRYMLCLVCYALYAMHYMLSVISYNFIHQILRAMCCAIYFTLRYALFITIYNINLTCTKAI